MNYLQLKALKAFLFIFSLLVCPAVSFAQCTPVSFTVADSGCANSPVTVTSVNSSGADISWDFCPGDLSGAPVGTRLTSTQVSQTPYSFRMFQDGNSWVGFAVTSTGDVLRYDFGSDILNTMPVISNLGNFSLLTTSLSLSGLKDGNDWYIFVTNINNALVRLSFGSSLLSVPTATNINSSLTLGLDFPTGIQLVKEEGDYFAFISNYSGSNLIRLSFGNSLANAPSSTPFGPIPFPYTITTTPYLKCDSNTVMLTGFSDHNLYRVNFGSSFSNNSPTIVATSVTGLSENVNSLWVGLDDTKWYLFAANYNNGKIIRAELGSSPMAAIGTVTDLGNQGFNNHRGFGMYKTGTRWVGMSAGETERLIFRFVFPDNCSALSSTATGSVSSVTYTAPGYHKILLTARDTAGGIVNQFLDSVYIRPAPRPGFSSTGPFCVGNTVSFTDTSSFSSGLITNRSWDFGGGNTATGVNSSFQFSGPGIFPVSLTLTNSINSCLTTLTKSIQIFPNPIAGFTTNDSLCVGAPFQFTDTSNANTQIISMWNWNFGDNTSSTLQNPQHSYPVSGLIQVQLIVTTTQSCRDTAVKNIFVKPGAVADYSVENSCLGDSTMFVNLSFQSDPGNPVQGYSWTFGDNTTSTAFSPGHLYASGGTYQTELVIFTANGCTDTLTQAVTVAIKANPGFSLSSDSVCIGSPLQITDLSTLNGDSISSWTYSFGEGGTMNVSSPVFVYDTSGTFVITQVVTTGTSCDTSTSLPVVVKHSGTADFTVSNPCENDVVGFTSLSVPPPGAAITSLSWNFGDPDSPDNTSALMNPSHVYYGGTGTYTVLLTISSSNGCGLTDSLQVSILPKPLAWMENFSICEGSPGYFFDRSSILSGSIVSRFWDFGVTTSTTDTSSLKNPVFNYPDDGEYRVTLMVTSNLGCKDTMTRNVPVNRRPVADFGMTSVCADKTIIFYDNSDIQFPYSIVPGTTFWDFGGSTSTQLYPSYLYPDTGTYTVTYSIGVSSGCKDTIVKQIRIFSDPQTTVTVPSVCEDTEASINPVISIPGDSISRYYWYLDNQIISRERDLDLLVATPGIHSLKYILFSAHGCSFDTTLAFNVHPRPVVGFTASSSYGNPPSTVSFTNTSTGAASYSWNFGDGGTSTTTSPQHVYNDTGSFEIRLTGFTNNGCTDTAFGAFTSVTKVLDVNVNSLTYSVVDSFLTVTAEFLNLGTADVTSLDLILQVPDGGIIKDELPSILRKQGAPLIHTFTAIKLPGNQKKLCVIAANPNGEADYNPENNELCRTIDLENPAVFVFPNPADGVVSIEFLSPETGTGTLEILDSRGRLVYRKSDFGLATGISRESVDVSVLTNGLYFIKANINGTLFTSKLIVQ